MNARKNAYDFRTNRDRDAWGEFINRTDLTYCRGELFRLEFTKRREKKCDRCGYQYVDIRIVKKYPGGFGSDGYCMGCFQNRMYTAFEDEMDRITEQFHEYVEDK